MSRYKRNQGGRSYRRNIFFVTEGSESERAYLQIVWRELKLQNSFNLRFCRRKNSDIPSMLKSAEAAEKEESFNPHKEDEIWVILDYDEQSHFPKQFDELSRWEEGGKHRHVAITTPRFEYWLLLHLEEHPGSEKCKSDDYMNMRMPGFKKLPINTATITKQHIMAAADRAEKGDVPNCKNPSAIGSGLGRLINHLMGKD